MTRQLVNREELGKLIAQTSGAISMINESNYTVKSQSSNNTYSVTATKSGWACPAQTMRATTPSANMSTQLKFIAIKARHFNPVS